jgi:phosphoenolpyruvate carboxykinase (GTP)
VPTRGALNVEHLEISAQDLDELLTVHAHEWREEIAGIREHFATFGDRLPEALTAQLSALERRLG